MYIIVTLNVASYEIEVLTRSLEFFLLFFFKYIFRSGEKLSS